MPIKKTRWVIIIGLLRRELAAPHASRSKMGVSSGTRPRPRTFRTTPVPHPLAGARKPSACLTGEAVAMGIGRLQPWVRVRSRVVSRLLQRYALVTSRSAAAGPATSQAHPLGSRGMDTVEKPGAIRQFYRVKGARNFASTCPERRFGHGGRLSQA